MAKSVLFDESEAVVETSETAAVTRILRPTMPLPATLRGQATSFYSAKDGRQAQYKAWSPELQLHVRLFGEAAEIVFAAHGARYVEGVDTEAAVTLLVETYANSNGLLFEADGVVDEHGNVRRGYVSLNEYSVKRVTKHVPRIATT